MARTFSARAEAGNPGGEEDSASTASATRRILGLLRSIPPTLVCPTCVGWGRFSIVSSLTKQASIQPRAFKNLSRAAEAEDNLRKTGQGASPPLLFGVVYDDFDAEHAFAFGIDLQRHFSVTYFEDRHVIRRFFDHDSPS